MVRRLLSRRWNRRRFLQGSGLAAAGLAGYGLVGCGEEEEEAVPTATETAAPTGTPEAATPTAPPAGPQVLRLPMWEPGQVGPSDDYGFGAIMVLHLAYSALWGFDEARNLVAQDAAAYESPDGLSHIVTLRPDLKWSDGTPYNATDYVYHFTTVMTEFGIAPYYVLTDPEDPTAFSAPDERTLVVNTVGPVSPELFQTHYAGFGSRAFVSPRHKFEQFGREYSLQPVEDLAFSGPYIVESWEHNQRMVFARNPQWSGYPTNPDRLEATVFAEARGPEALAAFEAGELDLTVVPVTDLRRVLDDPNLSANAARTEWGDPLFVVLNTLAPGLNDVRVREALYGAIDRDLLVNTLRAGLATRLYTTLAPTMPGYDLDARPFPDASIEKSKQLLEAAGFPNGDGLPTYRYVTTTENAPIHQAVAEMWKQNLGVNVEIRTFDTGSYFAEVIFSPLGTDWGDIGDAFWSQYVLDYIDIKDLTTGVIYKYNAELSPELREQELAAVFELDQEQRIEKLKAWDLALAQQLFWIPLYNPIQLMVRQPGVFGDFYYYGMDIQRARYLGIGAA